MSRLNGAYPSVVAGVSQMPDVSRTLGQHSEQVNMVSDPVRGLSRRKGSIQLSAVASTGAPNAPTSQDATLTQTTSFQVDGAPFSVTMRTKARPAGSVLPDLTVVNDATGAQLVISRQTPDADLDLLLVGGVKAITSLGRFLVMSGNTLPVAFTTTENFLVEGNQQRHIVWVRGGAYSRTFQINLIRGNNKFSVSFTTPSASYPEALDTSDLLATDTDYLKKVNDRTNVYNSAATKWAGDALALSSPESVAARLAAELTNSGFLSAGATVSVVGSSVAITDPSIEDVEVDDGGDQSLMTAAGNTVKSVETLTSVHFPGKILRVRAQDGADAVAFYMKAVAKDGSTGAYTEVSWEEAAGTTFQPTRGLCFGTVIGNTFHIGSSPAAIRALTGLSFPDYQPNRSGDAATNKPPEFLRNGRVDMLTVFQDRVMIGAKNAVNTSVVGDYLNFFRASVVTVSPADPVNFGIIGGEEDTLRKALKFDLNLILFGDAQQYSINGRRPFVPGQVNASVMSTIPSASAVQPVMGENYMMFTKANGISGSLHRFRPGEVDGSPVVEEVSDELDDYIKGAPVGLIVHDTPNFAFVRTTADPNTIYVYQFKDYLNGKTAHRAWHKWTFSPTLGVLYGISTYNGYLRLVFRRNGHIIVDSIALDVEPDERPFLDSMVTNTVGVKPPVGDDSFQVAGRAFGYAGCSTNRALGLGANAGWYGVGFQSYFIPGVPFLLDRNGLPLVGGETTVQTLRVHTVDTGGLSYQLRAQGSSVGAGLRGALPPPPPPLPPGDPNWANVVLALDFEGPGFVDRSSSPRTIVVSGDAQISATDPKFGAGCGLFDGSGDFLQVTDIGNFAAEDFTVRSWVFLSSAATGSRNIVDTRTSTLSSGFVLYVRSDNMLTFGFVSQGSGVQINMAQFTNPGDYNSKLLFPRDQWVHVEMVSKVYPLGATSPYGVPTTEATQYVCLFINGSILYSDTSGLEVVGGSYTPVIPSLGQNLSSTALRIGAGLTGANFWSGRLDDLRITKKALHTNSFTPPIAALPNY